MYTTLIQPQHQFPHSLTWGGTHMWVQVSNLWVPHLCEGVVAGVVVECCVHIFIEFFCNIIRIKPPIPMIQIITFKLVSRKLWLKICCWPHFGTIFWVPCDVSTKYLQNVPYMSWSVAHSTNAIVTYYMVSKHIEFIFAKYLHTPVVLLDQINRLWLDH